MEDREVVGQRVEARVVAERALAAPLARLDVAFEHDVGLRRHLEVDRPRLHQLDPATREEPREQQLVEALRHGRGRRVAQRGLGADGHGHLEALPQPLRDPVVLRAALVALPVHAGRASVEHLHAVHADVAHARLGVLRDDQRERDVAAAVFRPRAQDRDLVERSVEPHDLLARRVLHGFRQEVAEAADQRQQLHRVEHAASASAASSACRSRPRDRPATPRPAPGTCGPASRRGWPPPACRIRSAARRAAPARRRATCSPGR